MLNEKIFDILFVFANKNEITKKTIKFITKQSCNLFFLLYIIGLIYILFNLKKYEYIGLLKYILVPFITIVVAKIIRKNINKKRPFEEKDIISLVQHKGGNSMPSNHSASAMVLAMAIIYINPKFAPFVIFLAITTGISRIMAGVHYPADVLAGFFMGALFGILGFFILC